TVLDDLALSKLTVRVSRDVHKLAVGEWIRLLRNRLRMTQAELAQRAHITQPNLAAIESGKVDPQVGTLRRIYEGLECELNLEPLLHKSLEELTRDRARAVALKRLKHTMGTMALEDQAPDEETFKQLLEKRTDDILRSGRKRISAR
ncbi:MAG: helix-turn-helix domain-containing protein, partial [Nitrospira sp.]|nr:helix-turn-helix domain-containing protein [Nitrospira sp.]